MENLADKLIISLKEAIDPNVTKKITKFEVDKEGNLIRKVTYSKDINDAKN